LLCGWAPQNKVHPEQHENEAAKPYSQSNPPWRVDTSLANTPQRRRDNCQRNYADGSSYQLKKYAKEEPTEILGWRVEEAEHYSD